MRVQRTLADKVHNLPPLGLPRAWKYPFSNVLTLDWRLRSSIIVLLRATLPATAFFHLVNYGRVSQRRLIREGASRVAESRTTGTIQL